ncbi:ABC transporter ATP-binding protein [Bordetella sp. 15P40C-2]|uniref:ABC transporter ATP-binding protein n=1 Tax=Bordetella sp. 15P40C-2 TaxID=2572246 RepID=UPI0013652F21|nr:ABC transporter ATP-binding protein [Bordetella sp. 15P40C-2]
MTRSLILDVRHLNIESDKDGSLVVNDVSLQIRAGEVLALIGESGSGKSTISLACCGMVRPGLRVRSGSVKLEGQDMLAMSPAQLRRLRGRKVAYVAQSAAAAFNPVLRLDSQITESSRIHNSRSEQDANQLAKTLYGRMQLPQPESIGSRYPHEVSGGQLQRFMIAMGMMEDPALIVFDEPTSALDVTTQIEVLSAMRAAVRGRNVAALFVSHDLPVVAQMADRILVLQRGRMIESNATESILHRPEKSYTQSLVDAYRRRDAAPVRAPVANSQRPPILQLDDVQAGYGARDRHGMPEKLTLHPTSLTLHAGEIIGIVGESGSGKSTLAQVVAGLLPAASGQIRLHGQPLSAESDRRTIEERRKIQILFQMADTALNPRQTIEDILHRVLVFFWKMSPAQRRARTAELLEMVQLPVELATKYPGQLSGGQKQRINLARALAAQPEVLICDEITSALDTVVGAAIVKLIERLRDELGLAMLFISHDLPTVGMISDQIRVMQFGRTVEEGPAHRVMREPEHAYTRTLLASVPELRSEWLDERLSLKPMGDNTARVELSNFS